MINKCLLLLFMCTTSFVSMLTAAKRVPDKPASRLLPAHNAPTKISDLIEPVFCHNGGFFQGHVCICRKGFHGKYCEVSDSTGSEMAAAAESPMKSFFKNAAFSCDELFCENESECVNSFDKGYYCKCRPGFAGRNCQNGKKNSLNCISTHPKLIDFHSFKLLAVVKVILVKEKHKSALSHPMDFVACPCLNFCSCDQLTSWRKKWP